MKLWRQSPRDASLLVLCVAQAALEVWSAWSWPSSSLPARVAMVALLTVSKVYGIVIVAHLFTHSPWFHSARLNGMAGVLNSLNIGQSVMAYRLTHVYNHHRYNNDRQGPGGVTRDRSSTFAGTSDGRHAPLWRYAIGGALETLLSELASRLAVGRLWRVAPWEHALLSLMPRPPHQRQHALGQIQRERAALALALGLAVVLRPDWVVQAWLPATALALALVNVQNYYEHFGALPEDRYANSASHYGPLYNRLTFNDGYHQEHHLQPTAHWHTLPEVRRRHAQQLDSRARIVSPVPALVGFLHVGRPRLDLAASRGNEVDVSHVVDSPSVSSLPTHE